MQLEWLEGAETQAEHLENGVGIQDGHSKDVVGVQEGHSKDGVGTQKGHLKDGVGAKQGHLTDGVGTQDGHSKDRVGPETKHSEDEVVPAIGLSKGRVGTYQVHSKYGVGTQEGLSKDRVGAKQRLSKDRVRTREEHSNAGEGAKQGDSKDQVETQQGHSKNVAVETKNRTEGSINSTNDNSAKITSETVATQLLEPETKKRSVFGTNISAVIGAADVIERGPEVQSDTDAKSSDNRLDLSSKNLKPEAGATLPSEAVSNITLDTESHILFGAAENLYEETVANILSKMIARLHSDTSPSLPLNTGDSLPPENGARLSLETGSYLPSEFETKLSSDTKVDPPFGPEVNLPSETEEYLPSETGANPSVETEPSAFFETSANLKKASSLDPPLETDANSPFMHEVNLSSDTRENLPAETNLSSETGASLSVESESTPLVEAESTPLGEAGAKLLEETDSPTLPSQGTQESLKTPIVLHHSKARRDQRTRKIKLPPETLVELSKPLEVSDYYPEKVANNKTMPKTEKNQDWSKKNTIRQKIIELNRRAKNLLRNNPDAEQKIIEESKKQSSFRNIKQKIEENRKRKKNVLLINKEVMPSSSEVKNYVSQVTSEDGSNLFGSEEDIIEDDSDNTNKINLELLRERDTNDNQKITDEAQLDTVPVLDFTHYNAGLEEISQVKRQYYPNNDLLPPIRNLGNLFEVKDNIDNRSKVSENNGENYDFLGENIDDHRESSKTSFTKIQERIKNYNQKINNYEELKEENINQHIENIVYHRDKKDSLGEPTVNQEENKGNHQEKIENHGQQVSNVFKTKIKPNKKILYYPEEGIYNDEEQSNFEVEIADEFNRDEYETNTDRKQVRIKG